MCHGAAIQLTLLLLLRPLQKIRAANALALVANSPVEAAAALELAKSSGLNQHLDARKPVRGALASGSVHVASVVPDSRQPHLQFFTSHMPL
jgi:hypothetical protein